MRATEHTTLQDVVDMMNESLFDMLTDETGMIDTTRVTGMSKTKQVRELAKELDRIADREGDSMFSEDKISSIAQNMGVEPGQIEELIDRMAQANHLLKKGPRLWQLASRPSGPSQFQR